MAENKKNYIQSKIKVLVRIRPVLIHESDQEIGDLEIQKGKTLRILEPESRMEGTYDKIFDSTALQTDIFESLKVPICNVFDGINCTIFAYGQTGSGKTYTLFGDNKQQNKNNFIHNNESLNGVIPRSIEYIFQQIEGNSLKQDLKLYLSMFQIYNEKIYDLLEDDFQQNPLEIRSEKFGKGTVIVNLSEFLILSKTDMLALLKKGEDNRIKRQTKINLCSSRSHTLFRVTIEKHTEQNFITYAQLNICDLAGSEKWNKDEQMQYDHITEMTNINLSLTTLGKVIVGMSRNESHIPYRDSKLTRILQNCLGGNNSTFLIATISPLKSWLDESISTLKFAERVKQVQVVTKQNIYTFQEFSIVQKQQKEVKVLQTQLEKQNQNLLNHKEFQKTINILKSENDKIKSKAPTQIELDKVLEENQKLKQLVKQQAQIINKLQQKYSDNKENQQQIEKQPKNTEYKNLPKNQNNNNSIVNILGDLYNQDYHYSNEQGYDVSVNISQSLSLLESQLAQLIPAQQNVNTPSRNQKNELEIFNQVSPISIKSSTANLKENLQQQFKIENQEILEDTHIQAFKKHLQNNNKLYKNQLLSDKQLEENYTNKNVSPKKSEQQSKHVNSNNNNDTKSPSYKRSTNHSQYLLKNKIYQNQQLKRHSNKTKHKIQQEKRSKSIGFKEDSVKIQIIRNSTPERYRQSKKIISSSIQPRSINPKKSESIPTKSISISPQNQERINEIDKQLFEFKEQLQKISKIGEYKENKLLEEAKNFETIKKQKENKKFEEEIKLTRRRKYLDQQREKLKQYKQAMKTQRKNEQQNLQQLDQEIYQTKIDKLLTQKSTKDHYQKSQKFQKEIEDIIQESSIQMTLSLNSNPPLLRKIFSDRQTVIE